MSYPTTRQAYQDCISLFERALEDSTGIRVRVASEKSALQLRSRLHQARKIDRQDNSTIYPPGHAMFGASVFDQLIVRIRADEDEFFWVYIERGDTKYDVLENLSELDHG